MCTKLWRQALLIRRTEEKLLELYSQGMLNGTIHTCIGQEWSAVAVCAALGSNDWIFSNHRGHGHFLARTGDVIGLISEIMGKEIGVCGGVGGSQHLIGRKFLSNGILGGMWPIAGGVAFKLREELDGPISTIFAGDGSLGEGLIYETLNLASKWQVPLLVVIENNGIAQSTDTSKTMAGTIRDRAAAFGIQYEFGNTWNPEELVSKAKQVVENVRASRKPLVFEIETYRLKPHSKGDDTRSQEQVLQKSKLDPIGMFIETHKSLANELCKDVNKEIEEACSIASLAAPALSSKNIKKNRTNPNWSQSVLDGNRITDLTYAAIDSYLASNKYSFLLGEDVEAPYGGAFKITRDLSEKYPGRVRNTPICEAAIVGYGTGIAIAGGRSIIEIMFGDFTTLIFDQLIQHACKFRFMYGGTTSIPLTIRTPMGGRRGYGPTHSQSIEKHFIGIPNLTVLALNKRIPVLPFYTAALSQNDPVLIIENKLLYTQKANFPIAAGVSYETSDEEFPWTKVSWRGQAPTITLFCYGEMLSNVEQAMLELFDEYEIPCEILVPSKIHPLDIGPLVESILKTKRLLTCEEGTKVAAVSAEVIAQLSELKIPLDAVKRISYDGYIPSSSVAEAELLPSVQVIKDNVVTLLN